MNAIYKDWVNAWTIVYNGYCGFGLPANNKYTMPTYEQILKKRQKKEFQKDSEWE